jgi:hypothetical protein
MVVLFILKLRRGKEDIREANVRHDLTCFIWLENGRNILSVCSKFLSI